MDPTGSLPSATSATTPTASHGAAPSATPAATAAVALRPRGLDRLRARHAWIYRSDIADSSRARPGDVVDLLDARGRLRARALYSDRSEIALRVVSIGDAPVDAAFWARRLDEALAHRERVMPGRDALRLVNGEGDGLPSLVIDRYADVVVLQTLSQAMDRLKPLWCELVQQRLRPRAIVERNDARVRELEGLPRVSGILAGEDPGEVEVHQGPARLRVSPLRGQKTGAFLDQQENREAAAKLARGDVLDAFCGEGAFAVRMALANDVTSVLAIESSAPALERARTNAQLNGVDVTWTEGNAFDALRLLDDEQRRFDTIVLDPPAFAKNRASLEAALRGYKEINLRAFRILRPGGVLVTSTCSYHVHEGAFLQVLGEAAGDAGRDVTLLEKRTQAADHPIRLTVPETYYLKCMVLRVQ
jgi:23S rRNA (cytosine1962-C5)-methyltransferase